MFGQLSGSSRTFNTKKRLSRSLSLNNSLYVCELQNFISVQSNLQNKYWLECKVFNQIRRESHKLWENRLSGHSFGRRWDDIPRAIEHYLNIKMTCLREEHFVKEHTRFRSVLKMSCLYTSTFFSPIIFLWLRNWRNLRTRSNSYFKRTKR